MHILHKSFLILMITNSLYGNIVIKQKPSISIKIHNAIDKKSVGYKKFYTWYYPSEFTILVNEQVLECGESITVTQKPIKVTYEYIWNVPLWGMHKGKKEVLLEPVLESGDAELKFNGWDTAERIVLVKK